MFNRLNGRALQASAAVAAAAVLAISSQTTLAQEDDEDAVELETFEVTGSRIKRSDYETAQPVLVIGREEIERTGLASIGELIKDLPQAGASIGRSFNNGGDGSVEIDLRNLGSTRVLVLVDGKRWIPGTRVLGGGGVDLSTIPVSVVERIEILQDGASAVYGSDAVAGVVNIITRRDFQGLSFTAQYGGSDEGDAREKVFSAAAGTVSAKTSVFFDISYRQVDPIFAGDRAISAVPRFGVPNASRGSLFTPQGSFLFVPETDELAEYTAGQPVDPCFPLVPASGLALGMVPGDVGPVETGPLVGQIPEVPSAGGQDLDEGINLCFFQYDPGGGGGAFPDYSAFNFNTDAFNFAPLNYLITPQERSSIYAQGRHQITDSISAGAQMLYNVRESQQVLANNPLIVGDLFPFPFNQGAAVEEQEFNPFPQDIGRADASGLQGLGAVGRRMLEAGPRDFQQKNQLVRFGIDLAGTFDLFSNFASWELGYIAADSETRSRESGLQNLQRVSFALGDPANCDRGVAAGDSSLNEDRDGPCVPLDLFNGFPSITDEQLEYINYTAQDVDRNTQQITFANFSTEVIQTADFLPAPLGVAVGIERRIDTLDSQPDPLKVNGTSSTNLETVTRGETQALEAYVELGIPILADLPYIQDLSLTVAARRSEFTIPGAFTLENIEVPDPNAGPGDPATVPGTRRVFDDAKFANTSGKIGLEYRPADGLLLRAGWSDSFRAPSVSELFLGALQSFPSVADPCSNRNDAERDGDPNIENIRANCTADGVPEDYSQTGNQITTVFGGNPQLQPETANSYSTGFVMNVGEVFDVAALDSLDVIVDAYRYELENFITVNGAAGVLALCYASDPAQRSQCEFVNRTPAGQIANLQTVFANVAKLNTDGVDIEFKYDIPFFEQFGDLSFSGSANYTHSYEQINQTPNGEVATEFVGYSFGVATLPRWKANTSLAWSNGSLSASWDVRFIDRTYASCDDGAQALTALNPGNGGNTPVLSLQEFGLCSEDDFPFPGGIRGPAQELDRTFYSDFQFGWAIPTASPTKVTFGVRNAFNQSPPVNYTARTDSFNGAVYDVPGRQLYLRLNKDF